MSPRGSVFPIIEVFGYAPSAKTADALDSFKHHRCPFAGVPCEKHRQYGFGYCSVTYAAADDAGVRYPYAVCDHRLDGPPVRAAIDDHFGKTKDVTLVPEIVLPDPRTSFDYVAFRTSDSDLKDIIAIETQAIDLRGGGVGPAWRAWVDGKSDDWRRYFTDEATLKKRRDTVAYGVNMANIYKRLGLQVAEKGTYLKNIGVPFYVVMQQRPFLYLKNRIPFEEVTDKDEWDITFVTFDYTGEALKSGMLEFKQTRTVRTTLANYVAAMSMDRRAGDSARQSFVDVIRRKAGL